MIRVLIAVRYSHEMVFRNLKNALANLLGRSKSSYKAIAVPVFKSQFLGEPAGDVEFLKHELAKILVGEGNTKTAYLSRIQYPGEDRIRVALIIDGAAPAAKMAKVIATNCAPLVPIDIMFFEDLSTAQKKRIQDTLAPFYSHP